jgi:formate hydrogenlyase regulatory protein HycA
MPVPELVPVAREPGYHTDTIGQYRDGQFYAAIRGAHRDDDSEPDPHRDRIHWYAYLHLFGSDGRHRRSEISLIGIAPYLRGELRERADAQLAALLGQLEGLQFGDIAIRLFCEQHDGVTFGLIDESGDRRESWVELYPDRLGFCEPWDGSYST